MHPQLRLRENVLSNLKEARGIKSDEILARMIGVNRSTLYRIKEGGQPSPDFIAGLVMAFGIGLDTAFEVVEKQPTKKQVA